MDRQELSSKHIYNADPPPYEAQQKFSGYERPIENIVTLPSNVFVNTKMEKFSAITNCTYCNLPVQTNVEKKVNGEGWAWAILCCCFGSPILAFLVWFVDCFNEWTHTCPRCNKVIAKHTPPASFEVVCLLVLTTLLVIALLVSVIGFYVYYLVPQMEMELNETPPAAFT